MNYKLTIFGVKDTTDVMVAYIHKFVCQVDLVITIHSDVLKGNQIAGYKGLNNLTDEYGIEVYETSSYSLQDTITEKFFQENSFELGISMGWQRLIPTLVLNQFQVGIFGFHGSCGYLPYGRGRSPLNWSVINGDERFILNLFQYDEEADSPNVFANEMFAINEHDNIRTLQYKNLIASKRLAQKLIEAYQNDKIMINHQSQDFDGWYSKRTQKDGKIDFHLKTREIYNLVRGVTKPFPGAFAKIEQDNDTYLIQIWKVHPFDAILDFSEYEPGEIIEIMDENLIIRTVDGSLLIEDYQCSLPLKVGDVLE